ncbi:MAG TPA: HAD hydrolase-like protein [Acidimicrobiales bacterium]
MTRRLVPVFDLDGTLLDSDDALVAPFLALGISREAITFGPPVAIECERLGVAMADYVSLYDPAAARPFDGVADLLHGLDRWAVCSNKHPAQAAADLALWGWQPDIAMFSDAFDWQPKRLEPVLERLGLAAHDVVYVGDSHHDRACAMEAGVAFVLAGWNPRTVARDDDVVAARPGDVAALLAAG